MNNILRKAPQVKELSNDFLIWLEELWLSVTKECSESGDANYTIPSGSNYHAVTGLSASRTLTLPPSEKLKDGQSIVIQDESGAAGTHSINFSAQGGDTLYGSSSISSNNGRRVVIKRGKGKFFSA